MFATAIGNADHVVPATKVSRPTGDDPNHQGTSRRWIMTAVENSVRGLQTGQETLSALNDLVHSGKVRRRCRCGTSWRPSGAASRRGFERFHTERS